MALIKCEECGKKVSDKATFCPHCGCPVIVKEPTIICQECGTEYLRKNEKCPNCGCPSSKMGEIAASKKTLNLWKERFNNLIGNKSFKRGLIAFFLLIILSAGLYWFLSPKKCTLEHQNITGETLKNINGLFYTLWNYDNNNEWLTLTNSLSDCTAIGYYSGKDSLVHYSQFNKGKKILLLNNQGHPLCDYVMNKENRLTEFNAYGRFFHLETDTCLMTFNGEVYYAPGGQDDYLSFKGNLKVYSITRDSLYLSINYSKKNETEDITSYYPNGNVQKHKKIDNNNVVSDDYYKEDGTNYTELEQTLMKSKSRSCVFDTGLTLNGDNFYLFMYANKDDVSKGCVVFVSSDDKLRSCVMRYYYQYEIQSTQLTLSRGGQIRSYSAFSEYTIRHDQKKIAVTINGKDMNGYAPNYNGTTIYRYMDGEEAYPSFREYEKLDHLDVVRIRR
jgi:ribosomal protein L37E